MVLLHTPGLSFVAVLLFVSSIRGASVCRPGVPWVESIREVQEYSINGSTAQVCAKLRPGVEYLDYSTNVVSLSTVEIIGNGSIVQCSDFSVPSRDYSVFPLIFRNAAIVMIVNVTFQNCQRSIQFLQVEQIHILMCNFSHFSPGGAVEISNSAAVTIELCKFSNNTSFGIGNLSYSGNAGAIAIGNNKDANSSCSFKVDILNSDFSNNCALAYEEFRYNQLHILLAGLFNQRGGAIACYATVSTNINISGCIIEDNFATLAGGGVYAYFQGDGNNSLTIHNSTFSKNEANYGGGVEVTIGTQNSVEMPTQVYVYKSSFFSNRGRILGGGFMSLQIDPEGNLNTENILNCSFKDNVAEVGAAIYLESRFIVGNVVRENRISLERCIFVSNRAERGAVFITGNTATFRGPNQFSENMGPSIRVVDALVLFGGENVFRNNVPIRSGLSGVLHLSSFGQMMLLQNVTLAFYGNTGSVGACIVVENVITDAVFPKQLYNPRCFLQYEDPTKAPSNWTVNVIFENNSAVVGPLVYASNLDGCLWYDLKNGRAFFSDNYTQYWSFMEVRNNYIIRQSDDKIPSHFADYFVQTDVHSISLLDDTKANSCKKLLIASAPGDTLQLQAIALDEFEHETTAFFELSQTKGGYVSKFLPGVVQAVAGVDTVDFTYFSNETTGSTSVNVSASFINQQLTKELTKEFTLNHTECMPGYHIENEQCICEETGEIAFCDPMRRGILLFDGLWGAPPSWSMTLVTHTCPAGYCNCSERGGIVDRDTIGCLLQYDDPFKICHSSRKGILCGDCRDDFGVGMLSNECRSFDMPVPQYYWLVPIYLLIVIPLLICIVRFGVRIPTALRSFIFYIQISPIATEYFASRFSLNVSVMKCFGSTLALYVPYDFSFHQGMTSLESYGLRSFTPLLALIVVPITLRIRYHSKFLHGLWTVVYLMYVMAIETAASLVYCPKLAHSGDSASVTVWFFNGTIPCYEGVHILLTIIAVVALFLLGVMIPAVGVIVYHSSIKAEFPVLRLSTHLEGCALALTNGLKDEYKWWPVFELCSRFIFVVAVTLLSGYLVVPLTLSILMFCVQLYAHPYRSNIANYTESCVFLVLVVILSFGNLTVFGLTDSPASSTLWPLVYYLPLAVGCLYAAFFIIYHVWMWVKSHKTSLKHIKDKSTPQLRTFSITLRRNTNNITKTTVSVLDDDLETVTECDTNI